MRAKIVFHDNSWIIGRRVSKWEQFSSRITETQGTHHWWVEEYGDEKLIQNTGESDLRFGVRVAQANLLRKEIIGKRVAIPINSMKYMVFL